MCPRRLQPVAGHRTAMRYGEDWLWRQTPRPVGLSHLAVVARHCASSLCGECASWVNALSSFLNANPQ
jgi:hypothetical protein